MNDILTQLAAILEERKQASPESSYAASLYAGGPDAILKKIGEEASEVIIAAKTGDREEIVRELADLWFHTLVLLAYTDQTPDAVLEELQRRFGRSGLDEKAGR